MRKIVIPNPDLSKNVEKTYLDADYTAAGVALTVVNNFGAQNNKIVIIGEPGEEKSESTYTTGQTGNTQIDLGVGYKFDHNKGTVIYIFEYDQVEIHRLRSGAWSLLSTSSIQWDKRRTVYVDNTGVAEDSYKYRLKNSQSGETSGYSPTIAGTGLAQNTAGYIIREIRKIVGDEDRRIVTDTELLREFNRLTEHIQNMRADWWFLLVDTYKADNGIATVAATDTYSLATYTDLNFVSTVRFRYNDGTTDNTYHLKQVSKLEIEYEHRDEDEEDEDLVAKYSLLPADSSSDKGYIRVWPQPENSDNGTFYPDYYKKMATIDDVADEIEVPHTQIFIDYGLGFFYRVKGDEARSDFYGDEDRGKVKTGLDNLKKVNDSRKRAAGQPKYIKTWKGRKAMYRMFRDHWVDRDSIVERYFLKYRV